jgi:hypothetical protein
VAAASLAPAPATAGTDTILSHEPSAPKVSAAAGVVAWSTFDPARGTWSLAIRRDGVSRTVAVAPRTVPFDVDVGVATGGQVVLAYSRCRREPRVFAPTGGGCDLYLYDLDSGRERMLRGPSTSPASEYLPSVAGGRIAFARIDERRLGAGGARTSLHVTSLSGRGRDRRVRGGTLNADDRTGPTAVELSERYLAFAWDLHGPAGGDIGYGTSELHVQDLSGDRTRVEFHAPGNLSRVGVITPTLAGDVVHYGRNALGEGDGPGEHQLRSYDLRDGTRTTAPAPYRLSGIAVDGATTAFVRCAPDDDDPATQGCDVGVRETPMASNPDAELARVDRPTTASTYTGRVAYSAYDAGHGVYRLMLGSPGSVIEAVPVAPRAVAFDVDLGPGPDGRVLAVYSRCRVEPRTGCDIFAYDPTTRVERRIAALSTASASEFLPSVWGNRVAFARLGAGRRTAALRVGSLGGAGRSRVVAERLTARQRGGPVALELFGRRLAVVWQQRLHHRSEIWLDTDGGRLERLAATRAGRRGREFLAPSFDRGVLSWLFRDLARGRAFGVRRRVAGDRLQIFVLPPSASFFAATRTIPAPSLRLYGGPDERGWALRLPAWLPELRTAGKRPWAAG